MNSDIQKDLIVIENALYELEGVNKLKTPEAKYILNTLKTLANNMATLAVYTKEVKK